MQNTDDAIRQDELGDANLFIVCTGKYGTNIEGKKHYTHHPYE